MRRGFYAALVIGLCAGSLSANDVTVWAHQNDIHTAAGAPGTLVRPDSLAYNPSSGKLAIACGGSGGVVLEWERGATTGTVLVPRANWGLTAAPSPIACGYSAARGTYLIAEMGDDVILEVTPGAAGQAPSVLLVPYAPTFPAGGLPSDTVYAYYKNQWTGLQQTVNRIDLTVSPAVEEEYVPYAAFQAVGGTGPASEMVLNSAGELIVVDRANTGFDATRGMSRWDETAAALVPIIRGDTIMAYTGEDHVLLYGLGIDAMDNMYSYEIYSASILKVDRRGGISTLITSDEIGEALGDPELDLWPAYFEMVNNWLVFESGSTSGHVLAVKAPIAPDMVTIPGTDYQLDGPTYTFDIGKYEITNTQYCTFLNDAQWRQQTDPGDPRCTNMWFDPSNGDVYMMDVTGFPPGSEWYDRTLYKTSDVPDSKIVYDPIAPIGSRYVVMGGFEHHPVGTVSWFGAAKFCNWLTIDAGMAASEICYREGTDKDDWYAITASDWANNGLTDAERLDLVRNYRGFRLPMDGYNYDNGGPGVAHSWNMDAAPYNEWYKAAAFDPAAPDTVRIGPGDYETVQPDHWIFGFGADTIDPADANLGNHGFPPPFNETRPVGFYDGVNTLADGTPTRDTRNCYGLYDLCGNVAEWMTDTALESPWSSTYRVVRGGRWITSDPEWATNSIRVITTARYYAENNIGFRLARSPGYGDFNADDVIDEADYLFWSAALTGPVDTVVPGNGYEACDYDADTHVDLRDFAVLQQRFARP